MFVATFDMNRETFVSGNSCLVRDICMLIQQTMLSENSVGNMETMGSLTLILNTDIIIILIP
jgi:hypothetical protein